MSQRTLLLLLISIALVPTRGLTQAKTIKVDLANSVFVDPLPRGQGFFIQGSIPKGTQRVAMTYREVLPVGREPNRSPPPITAWTDSLAGFQPEDSFSVMAGVLHNNRTYSFCFAVYGVRSTIPPSHSPCDASALSQLQEKYGVPDYSTQIVQKARVMFPEHFTTDIGVMRSSRARYEGFVTGIHYDLAPLNPSGDLMDPNLTFGERWGQRLSAFVGISPVEVHSSTDQPVKKTALGIPVVGVGVRGIFYWRRRGIFSNKALQSVRLNTGVMFFKQDDANPLVDVDRGKHDLFVSLTVDTDLAKVLGPIAALFGAK